MFLKCICIMKGTLVVSDIIEEGFQASSWFLKEIDPQTDFSVYMMYILFTTDTLFYKLFSTSHYSKLVDYAFILFIHLVHSLLTLISPLLKLSTDHALMWCGGAFVDLLSRLSYNSIHWTVVYQHCYIIFTPTL